MKRTILRCFAIVLSLLMMIGLCGCEVDIDLVPLGPDETITVATTGSTTPQPDAWDGGSKKTTEAPTTTTEKSYATLPMIERDEKYDNPYGLHHTLLAYSFTDVYSKDRWLPSIGYIKDGKIAGVMYDSIILLPSPYNVYYNSDFATKTRWDNFRSHTYENFDTLNEAVIEVQNALNLKDYKIKVFATLVEPSPERQGSWGTLDGVSVGARNDDEQFAMVKYMIDSYIAEFNAKGYSNLELAGFYWFDESFATQKGMWYRRVTDYVHAVNKLVVHAPYFKSSGWEYSKTYGMDLVAMQSNYFHHTAVGEGSGSIARLAVNAKIVQSGVTDGITVECSTATDHDDVTTLKNTLATALDHGTDDAYHIYYFGGGATAIYQMSISTESYIRSAYDELYRYFNQTLTKDTMVIDEYDQPQEWIDGAIDYL